MGRAVRHWLTAQRYGRCPIPGKSQGAVGQVSEPLGAVEDVPAPCRGLG